MPTLPTVSPQSTSNLAQQLHHHAASTLNGPTAYFSDMAQRRTNIENLFDEMHDCKSRAMKAGSTPDENLANDLNSEIKKLFSDITKELNGMIVDTLPHLESPDFSRHKDDLIDNIAECSERHAECCRQYGQTLSAISDIKQNPTDSWQLHQSAYKLFLASLKSIDKGLYELEGRNRLRKQLDFKSQRKLCVTSVIQGACDMRNFQANQYSIANKLDVKANAVVAMVKFMQIAANHAIELLPANEHEELHRYLSDTLDDCMAAAEALIHFARLGRQGTIAVDGKQFLALLANARIHAGYVQTWAEKLLEQIEKTGSGKQKTDAYRSKVLVGNPNLMARDKIIEKRSAATAIFIESTARQAWYERQQIDRSLAGAEYGGNPDMHQSAKEWLNEFNKRSLALEGTLLTQLIPMLKKHHVDGSMDASSYRILNSAAQNLLALEQEASEMASLCREHGFAENIVKAHEGLANQKSHIYDMLKGDLKRIKDFLDLMEESSAKSEPAVSGSSGGKKKKGKARVTKAAAVAAAAAKQKQNAQSADKNDAQASVASSEAEDGALDVFDTLMEGTLAGRREGPFIIVDNDFTGMPVSYRQREDGLWVRCEDKQDAASVTLTVGAKIIAKADALEAKANAFAGHLNHESGGFSLMHFWHKRAMQAQYDALDYLRERIAYMKESKQDAQETAGVEQHLARAEARHNKIEQSLLEVARKRPELTNASLDYLLDRLPEAKVKKVVSRKPLAGNTKIGRTGIQADFMDEYQIDFASRNQSKRNFARQIHSLHVHYDRQQAELDKFTACHLKYGTDEEPVRNKVEWHLLEKIAARADAP